MRATQIFAQLLHFNVQDIKSSNIPGTAVYVQVLVIQAIQQSVSPEIGHAQVQVLCVCITSRLH